MLNTNEDGFGLVEVVVAMGLMGGLVLGFMRLSDRIVQSESKMMDLIEMNDLISQLSYNLNDVKACNQTMKLYLGPYDKIPSEIGSILGPGKNTLIETGVKKGRVVATSIKINIEENKAANKEGVFFTKFQVSLRGRSKLTKNKVFNITVPMLLKKGDFGVYEFISCDSAAKGVANEMVNQIMRRVCKSMSADYDEFTGTCKLDSSFNGGKDFLTPELKEALEKMLNKSR